MVAIVHLWGKREGLLHVLLVPIACGIGFTWLLACVAALRRGDLPHPQSRMVDISPASSRLIECQWRVPAAVASAFCALSGVSGAILSNHGPRYRTVAETNGDFSRLSQNFRTPCI